MAEDGFDHAELFNEDLPDAAPLLVAFVCGAIAGTALALLFAPATGRDSRTWLKQRAGSAGTWAAQAARGSREQVHALIRRYGVVRVFGRQRSDAAPSS